MASPGLIELMNPLLTQCGDAYKHHLAKKELKKLCDDAIVVRFLLAYYWWHVSHKHWVGNYCSPHMTCKHHNWNRTLLENELGMSNWVNSRCITYDIEAERHTYALVNYPPLVQIMVCRLADAKPLSEPMLGYCELDPWEQKLQWNLNQNL